MTHTHVIHGNHKQHLKHVKRSRKRHFVASGSLVAIGSGLLSFSALAVLI